MWDSSFSTQERRTATQLLFNRLLFICFLQQKQWLELDGSRSEYLFRLYDTTDTSDAEGYSFSRKLEYLFFSGLNSPNTTPGDRRELESEIGRVPFLNGGLFERSRTLDAQFLRNRAFEKILGAGGLLRSYNFTIEESTPLDQAVAIDPEMLGKVFEELVNKRHDTGSYYTPKSIVSFMCREALKGYLGGYENLVDNHSPDDISVPVARGLLRRLEQVKFCDPACGSGAYLVGMLQEIFALQQILDTATHNDRENYARKKVIIENCLYGVDIEPFAVSIAWLRLWLSLVIENPVNPLDAADADVALPNLDLKLEAGDSVASGNPQSTVVQTVHRGSAQQGLDFEGVDILVQQYIEKRRECQPTHGATKRLLGEEINLLKDQIKARVSATGFDEKAFLWPIEFPELFLSDSPDFQKGFDIVVANPPYVSAMDFAKTHSREYRSSLNSTYNTAKGSYDIYVTFFEQGLRLLKDGGQLAFITPNKYLSAPYAVALRQHMRANTQFKLVVDLSRVTTFATASVYPILTFLSKTNQPQHDIRVMLPHSTDATSENIRSFKKYELRSDVLDLLPDRLWGFLLSSDIDILQRLLPRTSRLSEYFDVNATTIASEADEYGAYLVDNPTPASSEFRVLNTGTIDALASLWGQKRLLNAGDRLLHPTLPSNALGTRRRQMYASPTLARTDTWQGIPSKSL